MFKILTDTFKLKSTALGKYSCIILLGLSCLITHNHIYASSHETTYDKKTSSAKNTEQPTCHTEQTSTEDSLKAQPEVNTPKASEAYLLGQNTKEHLSLDHISVNMSVSACNNVHTPTNLTQQTIATASALTIPLTGLASAKTSAKISYIFPTILQKIQPTTKILNGLQHTLSHFPALKHLAGLVLGGSAFTAYLYHKISNDHRNIFPVTEHSALPATIHQSVTSQKPHTQLANNAFLAESIDPYTTENKKKPALPPPSLDSVRSEEENKPAEKHKTHSLHKLWQEFHNSHFTEYFYDRNHSTTTDPKLVRLAIHFLQLKSEQRNHMFLKLAKASQSNTSHQNKISSLWITDKQLQDRFLYSQLVSFKEFYIFLTMLFKYPPSYDHHLAKLYNESIDQIHGRKNIIQKYFNNFSQETSRRYGAVQGKTATIQDFKNIIQQMTPIEMHSRLRAIKTKSNKPALNDIDVLKIKKQHLIYFLSILTRPFEKNIYLTHILSLKDGPPLLSANDILYKESLIDRFRTYLKSNTYTLDYTEDLNKDREKIFSTISEATIKQNLTRFNISGKRQFPHKLIKKTTKPLIIQFLQSIYDKRKYHDLFLAIIIGHFDKFHQKDIATNIEIPIEEFIYIKSNVISLFTDFLKQNINLEQGNTIELSFEEIEKLFNKTEEDKLLNAINNSEIFQDIDLRTYPNFNLKIINEFMTKYIQSNEDKHLFYNSFLKLDNGSISYISDYYQVTMYNLSKKMSDFKSTLLHLFQYGKAAYYKNPQHYYHQENIDFVSLKNNYHKLFNAKLKVIQERIKSYLYIHDDTNDNYDYLNEQNIRYIHDILLDSSFKKHIFYSFILRLEPANFKYIGYIHDKAKSTVKNVKTEIVRTLTEIATLNTYKKVGMNALIDPKNVNKLENLKREYYSLKKSDIIRRVKENLHNYFTPKHYNKEDIKVYLHILESLRPAHIDEFIYYSLKHKDILWMLYLTQVVGLGAMTNLQISESHFADQTTLSNHKKYIIFDLLEIIKTSKNYQKPTPMINKSLSLEELRELYNSLDHKRLSSRIKKSFNLLPESYRKNIEINYYITQKDIISLKKEILHSDVNEHIFLSSLLVLDNTSDTEMQKKYKYDVFTLRKKKSNLLKDIFLFLSNSFDYPNTSSSPKSSHIADSLSDAKKRYSKLSDDELIDTLSQSTALSNYEFIKPFITPKIIKEATTIYIQNRTGSKENQLTWHIYLCQILSICNITIEDLVFGYHVREKRIKIIYDQISRGIRYHLYKSQPQLRVILEDSPHKKRFARKVNSFSLYGELLPVKYLKNVFFSLNDDEVLKWFEHLNLQKDSDDPKITQKVIDIFTSSALLSELEWHVFFFFVISLDYTTPEHLASWYNLKGGDDILDIKNQLLEKLDIITKSANMNEYKLYTYLYEQNIIINPQGLLDEESRENDQATFWQLRERYRKLTHKEIIHHLRGSSSKALENILNKLEKKNLSPKKINDIIHKINDTFKYNQFHWHIYLSSCLKLDKSQAKDIAHIYQRRIHYLYALKSEMNKTIEDIIHDALKKAKKSSTN